MVGLKREIWWEKYRPKSLDEFLGQESVVAEIRPILEGDAPMQHFLFHSPEPGTGKTTLAHIIADTLGYQLLKFNASSKRQRGIEFVEEDVAPMSRSGQWETIYFLDEADRLTPQAQDALKGVIEDACGYFILTANDLSKITPWLQSRCQVRTFHPIAEDLVQGRLAKIAAREGVEVDDHAIRVISEKHQGDLRNSIGALQTAAHLSVDERRKFISTLEAPDFSAVRFLRLAIVERVVEDAVAELMRGQVVYSSITVRARVRQVFKWAIHNNEYARKVIEGAITSERDLIDGCAPEIVAWNFAHLLGQD